MDYDKHIQLSWKMLEMYNNVEDELLTMVAKRLRQHRNALEVTQLADGTTTVQYQAWQLQMLSDLGPLNREAITIIARRSGLSVKEVTRMLREAGYGSLEVTEPELAEAYEKGHLVLLPPDIENSQSLLSIFETYERQAQSTLNMVNSSMLDGVNQIYADTVNESVAHVLSGIKTPQQAIRDTLRKWAHKGVPTFVDKAGKTWSNDSYLNMVLRTMNNNIANDMQDARMDEYGVEYLEVSSKSVARPLCAPYQGRIFYRGNGSDPLGKYPSFSSTSYGEPAGLFGINCGHFKYAYVPGFSSKTNRVYGKDETAVAYEYSQKQRYYERRVRQFKREEMLMNALGDREAAKKANSKVLFEQQRLRDLTKQSGQVRRPDRERVNY